METQNITVAVPRDLYKRARILAAERDTSVSQLVREALERITSQDADYRDAHAQFVATTKKGLKLGLDSLTFDRDSLHERP